MPRVTLVSTAYTLYRSGSVTIFWHSLCTQNQVFKKLELEWRIFWNTLVHTTVWNSSDNSQKTRHSSFVGESWWLCVVSGRKRARIYYFLNQEQGWHSAGLTAPGSACTTTRLEAEKPEAEKRTRTSTISGLPWGVAHCSNLHTNLWAIGF